MVEPEGYVAAAAAAGMAAGTAAEAEGPKKPKGLSGVEKADGAFQRHCNFTLMDTVEDGVRVRMLNVWAFLLVYIFFVFGVLKTAQKLSSDVTAIEVSTPLSKFTFTNRAKGVRVGSLTEVTPRVGIFDNNGNAVQGATVQLEVADFSPLGPLPCSVSEQQAAEGTLEPLRYKDTCNYLELNGSSTDASSDAGLASFNALDIRGPAGLYSFAIKHEGVRAGGQQKVTVSTPVAQLSIVDPDDVSTTLAAPSQATVGQPLAKQPAILITDDNGLPLENRYVTVFANADPTWPPETIGKEPPSYDHRGQKFAELSCATSLPSDEQGIARFTCLGIEGTTTDHVYFIFAESGFVFTPWNDPTDSPGNLYPLDFPRYRYPTRVVTSVSSVETLNAAYTDGVQEGTPLSPEPVLRLQDSSGSPVPDTWCYAIVTAASGQYLPLYFRRQRRGHKHKELLKGRAKSDANGIVTFSNLTVSTYGNTVYEEGLRLSTDSSVYIGFVCDGKFPTDKIPWDPASRGFLPQVESKVASVTIQRFTKDSAYVTPYHSVEEEDTDVTFTAVVRVLDTNGMGVAGKTVLAESVSGGIVLRNMIVTQETTSDSGFVVVNFAVVLAPLGIRDTGTIKFRARFRVDGVLSAESDELTARLSGVYNPSICHAVIFGSVSVLDPATHQEVTFDVFQETPYAMSGSLFVTTLYMLGQSSETCVHYPELVTGSIDKSNCPFGNGRRLQDSLRNHTPLSDAKNRLRGLYPGNSTPSRRLATSADGSITVNALSGYSDDGVEQCNGFGECEFAVKYQPRDLFDVKVTNDWPPPTLAQVSAQPGWMLASVMTQAPQGDHFLKFKVTITPPGHVGPPQVCYGPPLNVRILNMISKLDVMGDEDEMFAKKILPTKTVNIKVKFYPQNPETLEQLHPSQAEPHHLARSKWELKGVYWKWVEVPMNSAHFFDSAVPPPPDNGMYRMEEAGSDPWDAATGTLSLTLTMTNPGLFGRFALQFGSSGLWTRVFTFEVVAPSQISMSVVQAPGFAPGQTQLRTQTYLPKQPVVKVTAGGRPLEGVVVTAELVPEEGAVFSRLTDIPLYSPLPLIYSRPSDADGLAVWEALTVLDGMGCTKFKFTIVPGEVESEPVPRTPLCFKPAYRFIITEQPPATLPIGVPLEDLKGVRPMEVEAHVDGNGAPSLACPEGPGMAPPAICPWPGARFMLMRVLVAEAGGQALSRHEAMVASRTMLKDQVCLWVYGKEMFNRCSDLEYVQLEPYVIIRFQVKRLSWSKVTKSPADIKLMVSDLSGSIFDREIDAPDGLAQVPAPLRVPACTSGVMAASTLRRAVTTGLIKAELAAASASVVLPPPQVVMIGKMFLVRLQLLTKQGSPVPRRAMRACIVKASSTSPSILSPAFLQSIGNNGFTMDSACGGDSKVTLASAGTVRRSLDDGKVSFPLTVEQGQSGTYKLFFAPEEPGARVQAESESFKVFNPISAVAGREDSWGSIEVTAFGESVLVPRKPVFRVETSAGETLEDLEAEGIHVRVEVELKGVSEKRLKAQEDLLERRRLAAIQAQELVLEQEKKAKAAAHSLASSAAEPVRAAAASAAHREASSMFAMFSDEFRELCETTPVAAMASGAASGLQNFTEVQLPSMSDEVAYDPSVIDPATMLGQFVGTMTAGGQEMQSADMMQPTLKLDLGMDALVSVGNHSYTLRDPLYMKFSPGFQYQIVLHVNGVIGAKADFPPFGVVLKELPPEERAFNWLVSVIAVVISAIALTTNTTKHRARWFAIALIATAAVCVAVPFLKQYEDALGGYWILLAYADLVFIFCTLVWGLVLELLPGKFGFTFQQKRTLVYEDYARRRFKELMAEAALPKATVKQNIKAMFKPFSSQDAFYYPSNLLCAGFIATGSFVWILVQVINSVDQLDAALHAMLNRAISALLRKMSSINDQVYVAIGRDLPDETTEFLYKQLDIVTGWFNHLVVAINTGVWIGIIVAFSITTVMIFFTFYDFRRRALELRRGAPIGQKGVQVKFSAAFIGLFISSTIIGFLCIVMIVTLLVLPLSWPLLWNMVWDLKWVILSTVIPALITPIAMFIFKFCAFGPNFFKNRALAAAFFFWQTYVSIIGGIAAAIVRFVLGIMGVLLMLPCVAGANTPETMNKVALLDAPHKSYLSAVLTYHVLNAPLFAVAASRLLRISRTKLEFKKEGKKWPKSKSLVILLLIRFPQLRPLRKSALLAARQEEQAKSQAAKDQKCLKAGAGKATVKPSQEPAGSSKLDSEIARLSGEFERKQKELERVQKDLARARSMRRELESCGEGSPEAGDVLKRIQEAYGEEDSNRPPPVQVRVAGERTYAPG